jgi:hypothetical protein
MTPLEHKRQAESLLELGQKVAARLNETQEEKEQDRLNMQVQRIWSQAKLHATLSLYRGPDDDTDE